MARRKTTKKPMAKKRVMKKRVYKKRPTNTSAFKSNFAKITRFPLGQSQMCVLPYIEEFQLSTNTGVRNYYTFSLNSAYDPNVSGGGHQPLGYDQMAQIFGKYCVIGAQAKITCWNRDADEVLGVIVHLSEQSVPPTNPITLMEQGACQYKLLSPTGLSYNNGAPQTTFYVNVSPKKFFRVSSLLDSSDFNVGTGSNPNRQLYLHIIFFQPDGGLNSAPGSAHVELRQRVIFNAANNVPQST